jgi:hypothetical protein
MDPNQLLIFAQKAITDGVDPAWIDGKISEQTGGQFNSIEELRQAVDLRGPGERIQTSEEEAALLRLNARGGTAFGDALRALAQGATLSQAPNIAGALAALPGGRTPAEAREESRQRIEDLRLLNPKATGILELAGGAALPGGAGVAAGRRATGLLARGGVPAARALGFGTTGAALGGAGAAVRALGEQETPGEVRRQAAIGGGLGAALAPLGARAAGAAARRTTSRADRLLGGLEETTGVTGEINKVIDAADQALTRVQQRFYQPLDRAFPSVDDSRVAGFLKRMRRNQDTAPAVRSTSRDLFRETKNPSFAELQEVRQRLYNTGKKNEGDELTGLMEDIFPRFKEGNKAWREALAVRDAIDEGRKFYNKNIEDINRALKALPSDEAREAFRNGQLMEVFHRLGRGEDNVVPLLRTYMDAGPGLRSTIRSMFPNDRNFNQFMQIVRTEADADAVATAFKRFGGAIIAGLGLGAGGAAAFQAFGG